jgi:hypothetical protein
MKTHEFTLTGDDAALFPDHSWSDVVPMPVMRPSFVERMFPGWSTRIICSTPQSVRKARVTAIERAGFDHETHVTLEVQPSPDRPNLRPLFLKSFTYTPILFTAEQRQDLMQCELARALHAQRYYARAGARA